MKQNTAFTISCYYRKHTGFAWNFVETPIQNVPRHLSPLFLTHPFSDVLSFQKYLNLQVRINKMVNSVVYYPFPSRLASNICPFIYLLTP